MPSPGQPSPRRRQMPTDFAERAPTSTIKGLASHYTAGETSVRRWLKEAGIKLSKTRDMPEDFAAMCKMLDWDQLRKHYRCGDGTLRRWRADLVGPRTQKPMPDDFPVIGLTMTSPQLQKHYGAGEHTIARWSREAGINRKAIMLALQDQRYAIPGDFAAMCINMTRADLCKHYGRSNDLVNRWLAKAGPDVTALVDANATRQRRIGGIKIGKMMAQRAPMPVRVNDQIQSEADKARAYLQRFGACFSDAYSAKPGRGGYWFKGQHFEADAIIAEAHRRGWRADERKELAA